MLRFAIPAGVVAAVCTFGGYYVAGEVQDLSTDEARTTATVVLVTIGLFVLLRLSRPLTPARVVLVAAMAGLAALAMLLPVGREVLRAGAAAGQHAHHRPDHRGAGRRGAVDRRRRGDPLVPVPPPRRDHLRIAAAPGTLHLMEAPEAPRPRRCDRPGCALAATSLLSFDGGTGLVRIQRLHANPPPLTLVLCTTHTDRLVVPRGWVLHDERDEGHLFATPGEGDA